MSGLLVAHCSHLAARYAVERWHYSGKMPAGKLARYGVWESDRFIGAVLYGRGANDRMSRLLGLKQTECVELVRVALSAHEAPVTQIIAVTLRELKLDNPGLRAVMSYADPNQGHHGGIYQAGNWIYLGFAVANSEFVVHGQRMHKRTVYSRGWRQRLGWLRENIDPDAQEVMPLRKHRYVMPLDKALRRQVTKLAKPYPHAVEASTVTRSGSTGESRVQLSATALTT